MKVISICKNGTRHDMLLKAEAISDDAPVISRGALVSKGGHKGKVLDTEGGFAFVSWEDAAISKVPIADLTYDGRVEKGGPGSGRYPAGSGSGDKGGDKGAGAKIAEAVAGAYGAKPKVKYEDWKNRPMGESGDEPEKLPPHTAPKAALEPETKVPGADKQFSGNVSQAEVSNYLDGLRQSGVTNMFGAAPYVERDFGLSPKEAKEATVHWMRNFKREK